VTRQVATFIGTGGLTTIQIVGLACVVYVVAVAFPSVLVAGFAERKGHPLWGWLVVSLVLGWPLVLLVALCIPDRRLARTDLR